MFSGAAVVFEKDHLRFDNMKCEKIDNPVAALLKKCSERPDLVEWVIDDVVENLKYLGRHTEARCWQGFNNL